MISSSTIVWQAKNGMNVEDENDSHPCDDDDANEFDNDDDDDMHNTNDNQSSSNNYSGKTNTMIPPAVRKNETMDGGTSMTLAELAQCEEESSRRLFRRLLLPQRIGATITFVAQVFVLVGITLNIFGYGYVRSDTMPYWIGIDTLEHRQFQLELRKR
jgi:hypothetical protein